MTEQLSHGSDSTDCVPRDVRLRPSRKTYGFQKESEMWVLDFIIDTVGKLKL